LYKTNKKDSLIPKEKQDTKQNKNTEYTKEIINIKTGTQT